MLGLTPFGLFHTLISLIAVIAGVASFFRSGRISPDDGLGKTYSVFTVASCVTALGIYHHGGFAPPHAVAILTLLVLAIVAIARRSSPLGRGTRYLETLGYSATFLFHLIPAVTETTTRLPPGDPLVADANAPVLKIAYLVLFVLFLVGATLQVRAIRRRTVTDLRPMTLHKHALTRRW